MNVEIPEILNAVPTRLSAIVIVEPAPDAVATTLPPTKFREVILDAVPTVVPSSLIVMPVIGVIPLPGETQERPDPVEERMDPAVPTLLLES